MTHALTKFRDDHGLTLEAFGQKIGVTKSQVWKWENGAIPRPSQMKKILAETGESVTAQDWYAASSEDAA